MYDILEIEFKGRRKEYAANPLQFPFTVGESAILDVQRGQDLGAISHVGWRPGMEAGQAPTATVLRKAAPSDLSLLEQNRGRERDIARTAKQKILDHHLDMKLVDVELQWDGRKITFYFTAEGRVDFRELVKDLASTFRSRIDLRQIGARDETKRIGGYGVCGLSLCCNTFLMEFKPITTQMPRDQFLPLNPSKLSGVCGRLKCCMRYELDVYRDFQRQCPKVGHPVRDDARGDGEVDKLDLVRDLVYLRYRNGETDKMSPVEFHEFSNWRPEMPKTECICVCGRKSAATAPITTVTIEEPMPKSEGSSAGEKVTLLAGGGLGMQSGTDGEQVHVGEHLDAPQGAPKKKRKRRRRKKHGGGESPSDSATPAPDSPDDD